MKVVEDVVGSRGRFPLYMEVVEDVVAQAGARGGRNVLAQGVEAIPDEGTLPVPTTEEGDALRARTGAAGL